ncbi:MAG: hypothetical protein HY738_21405 [Bacteroidia bacterium]|nr:hypothetical protein [Bacteroidia bacterium]
MLIILSQVKYLISSGNRSLIRNWLLLRQWADEEFERLHIFRDFDIQLQRWLSHNKSKDYLLPLGPLSYFEEWRCNAKINKYWLARYDTADINNQEKLKRAENKISDINEFLKQSRKELQRVEKLKKSMRIVYYMLSVAAIIVLTGLTYWAFNQRHLALRQSEIAEQQKVLAITSEAKAVDASTQAEIARENAEKNEKIAIDAKEQAEISKKIAIQEKFRAEQNAKLALSEKEKAVQAHNESEKHRTSAEAEKLRADQELIRAGDNFGTILLTKAEQALTQKNFNAVRLYAINALKYLEKQNQHKAFDIIEKYPDFPVIKKSQIGELNCFSVNNNGELLAAYFENNKIIVNNILTVTPVYELKIDNGKVNFLELFSDSLLAYSTGDKSVFFQNLSIATKTRSIKTNFYIKEFSYNPFRNELFMLDSDNKAHFNKKNGLYDLYDKPCKMFINEEGDRWGAVYRDYSIMLLNPEKIFFGHTDSIISAGFCSEDSKIISWSADKTIRIWDISSEQKKPVTLAGYTGDISCVGYNDGQGLLASGASDNLIKIWNLKSNEPVLVLRGHNSQPTELFFCQDSIHFISVYNDGTVLFWDVSNLLKLLSGESYENKTDRDNFKPDEKLKEAEKKYRLKLKGIELVM